MTNVQELIEKIESEAKLSPRELRFVRTLPKDRHVRQGDIFLWRIKEVPKGCTPRAEHQLALGTTQGSRHVIGPKAKLYDLPVSKRHSLLGPVIVLNEREEGTHPEHAHFSIPSCIVQVGYQLDPRTRAAVRD